MSNFDIDAYLANRTDADNKLVQLQQASARKIADLEAKRAHNAKIEEDNKQSLVNTLGLNPDGFTGGLVNLGAATAAGFSDSLDPAVHTDYSGNKTSSIQRRVGDVGISALKSAIAVPEMAVGLASLVSGGAAGKYLEEAGFRPEEAKAFLDSLRTHEQKAASQKVGGAEGFWNTLGEIADNPSVVPHALVESLFPMLAGGLAGRGLAALGAGVRGAAASGEGLVMAGSAAEQIRQNTDDGRLSLKQALAAAGTGLMGAGVARLSGAASTRMGLGDIDQAVVEGSLGTSQRGLLTRTVGSSFMEGGEETVQSTGEQILQNVALDKPLTQGVGNAAAMGLVTGLAMGTPMALAEGVGEMAEKSAKENSQKKDVDEAIKTGDVSALVDPNSPSYSPSGAIGALYGNTQAAKTPEEKEANLTKAEEILSNLNAAKQEATAALERTSVAGLQKSIDAYQSRLDGLDVSDPANARQAEILNLSLEALRQEMEDVAANPKESEAAARIAQAQLNKVDRELRKASEAAVLLRNLVNPVPEAAPAVTPDTELTASDVAKLLDDADKGTEEAVSKVITLAMRSPETLDATQVARLVNNASNGLTSDQRTYLRAFSEARIAANELRDMEMVSDEIINGSSENKGIATYRKEISQALQANNTKTVNKSLTGLRSFAMDHASKAAAAQEALAQGSGAQIVRYTDGTWAIPDTPLSKEALEKNGGLVVNSPKLVAAIKAEAIALDKAVAEMEAAVAVTGKKGTSNVTNQPQQAKQATQDTQAVPVQASSPVASPAPSQGAGDGTAGRAVSKPSTGTNVPDQSLDLLKQRLEYMNNPPADYTPEKGKKIQVWAKKQLENVTAALASEEQGTDRYNELDEARSVARALVKKATSVVEGDESLVEVEGTSASGNSSYTKENAKLAVEAFQKANPALLDKLTDLHAQDKTAAEISKELGIAADTVRELRVGLGLPEQGKPSGSISGIMVPADAEERAIFEAWRDARKTKPPVSANVAKTETTKEQPTQSVQNQDGPLPWESDEEYAARKKSPATISQEVSSAAVQSIENKTHSLAAETTLLREIANSLGIAFNIPAVRSLESLSKDENPRNLTGGMYSAVHNILAVSNKLVGPARMTVLLHELGHHIVYAKIAKVLGTSPAKVQEMSDSQLLTAFGSKFPAIAIEYQKWFDARRKDVKANAGKVPLARSAVSNVFYTYLTNRGVDTSKRVRYSDFHEWLADNIGKALESNAKQQSLVEKFFQDIADAFRKVYSLVTNNPDLVNFVPAPSVVAWIEQMGVEASTTEFQTSTVNKESTDSTTPVEQPTQSNTTTESEDRTSEDSVAEVITATQEEYDAAVQLNESSSEEDYETTPSKLLQIAQALSEGQDVQIIEDESKTSASVLTAFDEVGDEATPYYLQNLIARYWTQKAKNPGDASGRPLASVKDFYSALKAGTAKISDFLSGEELTEKQESAIKHFFGTAKRWMNVLESNMPKKKADEYRTNEMIQYLLTNGANGVDMDENVKMAIIAGAYSYLLDEAGKPAQADNKTINSILGRDKDAFVSHRLRKEIGTAGNYAHLVYDQIGGRVLDVLGLSTKPTASQEQMPKLRTELGIIAVMLLEDMKDANGKPANLVSRAIYKREEFLSLLTDGLSEKDRNKVLEKNKEISSFATQTFIALARNPDGSLPADVVSIVQANKESKSIVNKLFKVEGAVRFPSLEPIKDAQKKASRSPMDVPSDLRNVIKKNQARPRKFVKDMMAVASVFDLQEFEQLAGVKPLDEAVVHVVNRSALEAKNQGLQRELNLLMQWAEEMSYLESGQDSEFYLEFDVWKQQRVGIKTNGLNPQASKIVRHMIGSPEWESTIQSNDEEAMTSFYLRVAEGLGEKTEKTTNDKQIEGIKEMLKAPVYADAIAALRKVQNGEALSQEDKEAIKAGVAKGKENLHSLAALVAMARQQNAEAQAQGAAYEFTTNLMGEVDGVANGTMLNHALLGAGNTEQELIALLNQGGFFEQGSKYTQYNQYRGDLGNLDIYESTAREVYAAVKTMLGVFKETDAKIASVWNIAGNIFNEQTGSVTKEGRNLIKGALNPLAFGSAMEKVVQGMSDTFLESVYSGFEDLAKEGADQKKIDAYVDSINALIDSPKYKIQKGHGIVWHMSRPLSTKTEEAIKESFAATVGQATADTVEKKFAAFINARDSLNYVAQTTYSLHEAVYSGMREAYVKLLASKNQLPTDWNGKVIGDLNKEQEAEFAKQIRAVEPIIQTAFSNQSGEERAGLRGAKTKRKRNPSELYKTQVYFNKKQADGKASVGSGGLSTVTESPGVAMGSATTHSFDSWISHSVQSMLDVLNVHDALGAGVLGLKKAAQLLNQKTFEGLVQYSPAEEVYQSLSNVVAGISELAQKNALPQEALDKLQTVLWKISKDMGTSKSNALERLLSYSKQEAYNANTMKLRVLAKTAYVDQYAFEGGNYEVTDQDRDLIAQKLTEQSPDLTTQDLVSLKALKNLANVKTVPDSKKLAIAPQAIEEVSYEDGDEFDVVGEAPATPPTSSAFGALGNPEIAADKDLVSFFEQNQETTAGRVIQELYRKYRDDGSLPNQQFNMMLLKELRKVIDPSMKVRYITPKTEASSVLEVPKSASRGWYSVQGTAEEINVLSPGFVDSGLTPELLMHELTHSALLQTMRSGDAAIQPFVTNLQNLKAKAEQYAQANGLKDKHAAAFENLDEFVTWGMTNPEFQQEVLSQFYMKPADGTKSLVTALQEFIKNLTDMLFATFRKADGTAVRKSVGSNVNGMAIMINDAVQIMSKAAETKKGTTTATASMAAKIAAMTTLDIHHALDDGKVSREFQEQIGTVLISIVNKLHGPFGAFLDSMKSAQAITPLDVWTKALDTGVAPFASKVLASGFEVSQQEAFAIEQIEATVRAALDGNEANTKFAYRELAALYAEARKKLTVEKFHNGDWATATQSEKDNAQALHDFVFALEKTDGDRMDYLSRFAALGLGHEGFNKLLQMNTEIQMGRVAKAPTLVQKLQAIFQNMLEFLSNKVTGTYGGQRADAKLTRLVSNLVDIEAKKRHRIATDAAKAAAGPQSNIVDDASNALRKTVNNALNSSLIKKSSFRLVRGVGALARTVNEDRVEQFMDLIADLRDREMKGRPGILAGTFNTVRGPKAVMETMMRVAKGYEGRRKDAITAFSKMASQAFGKTLDRAQKASITRVFLRTGASTLLDSMSLADMEKLLSDKKALSTAIADAEKALSAFPQYQHYYKAQANALAFAKVVRNAGGFTMMNAGNIARMLGTVHADKVSGKALTEATQAIEKLVALYAIDYSPSADRAVASEILRDELLRTDGGNGVEFALKAHKSLEEESKQRLFKGQDALMMHGYTSEIYDPHVEVITAPDSQAEELKNRGYVQVGPVGYDQADPDTEPKSIFVLKDGGLNQYQSGALSITNKKAKGSNKHSGFVNVNTFDGAMNAAMQAEIMNSKQQEIADLFKPAPRKDLSKEKGNKLAPVLNANGQIVNWRYLMSEKNKDTLLARDNSFDNIIGAIAGSIYDKSTTQEQNTQVLETLKQVYDEEFARNPDSFIEVSGGSKDPEMLEIWNMLPPETKATAKRIFGADGIRVRKDSLDLVFGYRKLSLATLFDKENRNVLEDMFVKTVEGALVLYAYGRGMQGQKAQNYAKRAAVVVTRSERMWQSLVQETKDIIVVKTGTVLLGNVWSNLSLLWLKGVSFKEMAQHHAVAMAGATSYMADSEELARLRLLVQADYQGTEEGGMKAIQEKILVLEDALARNPVRELIEAGLMPSIVEDVAAEEDPYSYKSLLVRKMEQATAGVPKPLINAAKAVYMSKDGALYKGLYRATQLSDFVARYTLYQHLISREKNPMSKEAALFEASETFVNYDLPMHRALQYTDDMGLTPFMKYFLNIQRVINKTMRENPARVLGMVALGNVMDLGPIVLSSAAVTRIGNNPMESGAFKIFGTVDDLATINASMALIK